MIFSCWKFSDWLTLLHNWHLVITANKIYFSIHFYLIHAIYVFRNYTHEKPILHFLIIHFPIIYAHPQPSTLNPTSSLVQLGYFKQFYLSQSFQSVSIPHIAHQSLGPVVVQNDVASDKLKFSSLKKILNSGNCAVSKSSIWLKTPCLFYNVLYTSCCS